VVVTLVDVTVVDTVWVVEVILVVEVVELVDGVVVALLQDAKTIDPAITQAKIIRNMFLFILPSRIHLFPRR
jgi:hypothetical protein